MDVEDLHILWMYLEQVPWMNFICTWYVPGTLSAPYVPMGGVHSTLADVPEYCAQGIGYYPLLCLLCYENSYFNAVTRTDAS